jgi:hypothetical protein
VLQGHEAVLPIHEFVLLDRTPARRTPRFSRVISGCSLLFAWAMPGSAGAHHEAIFGPQSSLAFGNPGFLSTQFFARRQGDAAQFKQEYTFLVSGGYTPSEKFPLGITAILPTSYAYESPHPRTSKWAVEDAILGLRYRFDLTALQESLGKDANFVLAMLGTELPTGAMDHDPFKGSVGLLGAALYSLEWRSMSAITYGYYRRRSEYRGSREGDNLFFGAGLAYTPWDDPKTEELVSFQLGFSYETYFRDHVAGQTVAASGGWGALVHPTVVWGPGTHLLWFNLVSLPVAQHYRDSAQRDRWRFGSGLVYLFD